jgi:transposase
MQPSVTQSNEELLALVRQQQSVIAEQAVALRQAQVRIAHLEQEIADLKAGGGGGKTARPAPDFVKPNTPSQASTVRTPRKKRERNFTFHRLSPTAQVEHACARCPDCGHPLSGGWEASRRQVVEIPPVRFQVTDHILVARRCGVCAKVCTPEVDWHPLTGGAGHYGVRLQSLVAFLRTQGRLPVQTLAATLRAVYGLSLSAGAIVGLLHRVAAAGQPPYRRLWERIRAAPFVNADETGWRQSGHNGYLWSFSTPQVRAFVYDQSRSHRVPERMLAGFRGVWVSDFYSGYHYYPGLHQRCWVHLLRDLHDLKKQHPTEGVEAFVKAVRKVYDAAKAFHSEQRLERMAARLDFQAQLVEAAMP